MTVREGDIGFLNNNNRKQTTAVQLNRLAL